MRKTVAGFRNILEVSSNLNLAWKVILLIEQKWFINNPEKVSSWTGIGLAYFMIFKWFQSWFKINLNSLKYFDLSEKVHSIATQTSCLLIFCIDVYSTEIFIFNGKRIIYLILYIWGFSLIWTLVLYVLNKYHLSTK